MELSEDEKALLYLIVKAGRPVSPSDYFHGIHPPTFAPSVEGPERDAWVEKQIGLYGAYLGLDQKGLVEVAVPADGRIPDLVVPTDAGRALIG
ncbi:hypothetical protein [Kitasatospora sp. NPDC047058]|uniref:hypothetical protein n=1 Tax=Kitasatospora sp. NPDC047058 TaxID=3155620 RepID=UPI0033C4E18B